VDPADLLTTRELLQRIKARALARHRPGGSSPSRRFRAVQAYDASCPDPLVASRGLCLRIERRPSEWPGWVWGTDPAGQASWVPECWLRIEGDTAELLRDYDATELSVQPGDVVTGDLVESGWLWACTSTGQQGWVPLAYLSEEEG